jgi:hypothetical protein
MVHKMTIFVVNTFCKCILRKVRNIEDIVNSRSIYQFTDYGNKEKSYQYLKNEGFGCIFAVLRLFLGTNLCP